MSAASLQSPAPAPSEFVEALLVPQAQVSHLFRRPSPSSSPVPPQAVALGLDAAEFGFVPSAHSAPSSTASPSESRLVGWPPTQVMSPKELVGPVALAH